MRETTDTRHHILLVDDEPAVAQALSQILDNLGYRVTVCSESNGALLCFGSDPAAFDLLITDFLMPGRNGLQLSRALLETRPDLPILVCTGNPNDLPPPGDLARRRARPTGETVQQPPVGRNG